MSPEQITSAPQTGIFQRLMLSQKNKMTKKKFRPQGKNGCSRSLLDFL